jgi:hypothetical protein
VISTQQKFKVRNFLFLAPVPYPQIHLPAGQTHFLDDVTFLFNDLGFQCREFILAGQDHVNFLIERHLFAQAELVPSLIDQLIHLGFQLVEQNNVRIKHLH